MKTYKVVVSKENDDLRDLVNINNEIDTIPLAPDNFKDGEFVTEEQFYMDESNYVDEQGTGTMYFAFAKE